MDDETEEFYTRVRKAYLGIAEREPERFIIVKAAGRIDDIHADVMEIVTPKLQ
jgi:dTMP kinase